MPPNNDFRHQVYSSAKPAGRYELLKPSPPPAIDSDEYRGRMRNVGRSLRDAGVSHVILVHGTFAGTDALGAIRGLERLVPGVGPALRRREKQLVDALLGDAGNYTPETAGKFREGINEPECPDRIEVKLFHWSSENHHVSRADGAVRLAGELAELAGAKGRRLLVWGHSHAGNVFALLTNLLGGGPAALARFFRAAEPFYRSPFSGHVDVPVWPRVRRLLEQPHHLLRDVALDLVTFGTPIRYGWETWGYSRLLHFVNHHPGGAVPEYRAEFPPTVDGLLSARGGDYVQQLGIAGTNSPPPLFALRTFRADRRLKKLLQAGVRDRDVLRHLQAGLRVADEGTTLLVDYGHADADQATPALGHAIYTRQTWLLFHAEEIIKRFYGAP